MDDEEKKVSPWVYVAIGCSVPVVLIAIMLGATMFWGMRTAKHIKEDSPDERAARVKQVLGCDEIPAGYFPTLSVSIPFLMDLAILSDRPPRFEEKEKDPSKDKPFDKDGFIYVNSIRGQRGRTIRDYVEGRANASEILGQGSNVQIGDVEEIGRGSFPLGKGTAYYVANRGSILAHQQTLRGLVTVSYFDCGDKRFRIGIWFGADPTSGKPLGSAADYAGSHADEARIRDFLGRFAPCGR